MYSDFLSRVLTSADRDLLLTEVEKLSEALFEPKKGGMVKALASEVRVSTANLFQGRIDKGENMQVCLEGLKQALLALTEVNLTLAIEPTEETVSIIHSFLAEVIGNQFVIVLEREPEILAGAKIAYKGKYYDGALATGLENVLAQNVDYVLKTISNTSQ